MKSLLLHPRGALLGLGLLGSVLVPLDQSALAAPASPADAASVMRDAVNRANHFNRQAHAPVTRRAGFASEEETPAPETPAPVLEEDPQDLIPDEAPTDPFAGEMQEVAADQPLEVDNQGRIDGIYRCAFQIGAKAQAVYVSVNGKRDGQSIFVVADVTENSAGISGWGAGDVTDDGQGGYLFGGETDNQLPFAFAVQVAADGSATAQGLVGVSYRGEDLVSQLSCQSIW